ncbi:MAG: hypothetical protein HYU51_13435 [Candidatus Rokubacteria bacterium]|nr:hypothetical protein [Candidatus Rokubacteria bacterium]
MSDATRVDDVFRNALGGGDGDDRSVTLPPAFQGLPGMAHGGTVLALFDAAAGDAGHGHIVGHYVKRVPLGAPLRLAVTPATDGVACRLLDASGALLVDGRVTGWNGPTPPVPAERVNESGHRGPSRVPRDGSERWGVWGAISGPPMMSDQPLPVSSTCFVCGVDNGLGLRAQLRFDERSVRGTWHPRPAFGRSDGSLAVAAVTSLLDEAAFWLGALATGESGMTTVLDVSLARRPAFGRPLTVIGERAHVVPAPDDSRYLATEVRLFEGRAAAPEDHGNVVATGRIVFVAVRGAARRLVNGLLSVNAPEVIRRVFPAYLG